MRLLLCLLLLCGAARARENVLLIVIDDIGVDRIGAYGEHPDPGRTPHIDGLARRGVLFRNAWAYPACSPTRAAVLTGRYGFRTGIGSAILQNTTVGLGAEQATIPDLLGPEWTSLALGKWHLGAPPQGPLHPESAGFRLYAGRRFNFSDYYAWTKTVHGVDLEVNRYATSDTADDVIRAVESLPEPWFLYVCFNAAHRPFHAPPDHLHSYSLPASVQGNEPLFFKAMVEAMDTEIGRLLEHVDEENTTVVLLGDNGTDREAVTPPFDPQHAKGSMFEGGVNVPLIVAGPRVEQPGSECAALVGAVDLHATVVDLAGGVTPAEDSVSLVPYLADPHRPSLRSTIYSERFKPNGDAERTLHRRAIRDARYKYIVNVLTGEERFFDLVADPWELENLVLVPLEGEAAERYERLKASMAELVDS